MRLQRKMGLGGAVFFLVGNIVGASIFILPGELAGIAGPAVFLAYLLAAVPAVVNCLIAAQAGTLVPVSAADYVFTSMVLHPFLGFLKVWAFMVSLLVSTPLLLYGFADYLQFFLPDADRLQVALALLALLTAVNLVGLRTSVGLQSAMVVVFIGALLVFGVGGLFAADFSNLTPVMPNGVDSVFSAAVPAFFSYSGFLMLIIVAEEITEPQRNIPLTLLLTFIVVAAIYTLITLVLPALVPWHALANIPAPMAYASRLFLPDWFASFITFAALLAAATSANVLIITGSRNFFALARNRIYPQLLGRVSARTTEPWVAVLTSSALALVGVLVQGEIVEYAAMTVIASMLYGIVWAVALLRLPAALPEDYANARFRLGRGTIGVIAAVKITVSTVFLYFGVRDHPISTLLLLGILVLGALYYLGRDRWLQRQEGTSLKAILRADTDALRAEHATPPDARGHA